MPVVRKNRVRLTPATAVPILDSVAAHVASKLQEFGTDERTLTDELCDMFCIWSDSANGPALGSQRVPQAVEAEISKTTQKQEAEIGADFAIRISSRRGIKRALMQAKVFDPFDQKLRCDSPTGWNKLWSQLVLMRQRNGPLSFLLIYTPLGLLAKSGGMFGTWEQGLNSPGGSSTHSRMGTTLIAVDDLLDRSGAWIHPTPVVHVGSGHFTPRGYSLTQIVLDMLACRRGAWLQPTAIDQDGIQRSSENPNAYPVQYGPSRELGLDFREADEDSWAQIEREAQEIRLEGDEPAG